MRARSIGPLIDGSFRDNRSTTRWRGFKNGDLLRLAEKEYGVFVTVDRKISVQQDLTAFNIAVVLIRSRSNRLEDLRTLVPQLLETLNRVTPRALTTVGTI